MFSITIATNCVEPIKYIVNNNIKVPSTSSSELQGQIIDGYGKCRGLVFIFEDKNVLLNVSPRAPFNVKVLNDTNTEDFSIEFITRFYDTNAIVLIGENNHNVFGKLNDEEVYISKNLTVPTTSLFNKEEGHRKREFPIFCNLKQLARISQEYFLWLYSIFIFTNNDNRDDYDIFKNNHIKIIPDLDYTNIKVPITFETNNDIIQDSKLLLKSENAYLGLLYALKQEMIRRPSIIKEYKDRKTIFNYYLDLSDFKVRRNVVILKNKKSIESYINISTESEERVEISTKINKEKIGPYFFINELIATNKVWLVQNNVNLHSALNVSDTWVDKKYNKGIPQENSINTAQPNKSFAFYTYSNKDNIIRYQVEGEPSRNQAKIIAFKTNDDVNIYASLLL